MATYNVCMKIEDENGNDEVSDIDVQASSETEAIAIAYKMLQDLGNADGIELYDLHAELAR